jgi:hypothetical protein
MRKTVQAVTAEIQGDHLVFIGMNSSELGQVRLCYSGHQLTLRKDVEDRLNQRRTCRWVSPSTTP